MGRCYVIPGFRGWLAGSENHWKTVGRLIGTAHVYWGFRPLESPGARRKTSSVPIEIGGPPGNRTPNLRIKSPLLCLVELEAQCLC